MSLSSVFCFVRYKFSDYILHLQTISIKVIKKKACYFHKPRARTM